MRPVCPKGRSRNRSKNKPNKKAAKNTRDFLKITLQTTSKAIAKGIVVRELNNTVNKKNNIKIGSISKFLYRQKPQKALQNQQNFLVLLSGKDRLDFFQFR